MFLGVANFESLFLRKKGSSARDVFGPCNLNREETEAKEIIMVIFLRKEE